MGGRYGDDDAASPAPATPSPGELHRHIMERGRDLRAAALAEALARGGRLVQKVVAGLLGRGAPGGRGRRWRHADPCDA